MQRKLRSLCFLVSFVAVFIPVLSVGQRKAATQEIQMRNENILPAANAGQWFDSMAVHYKSSEPVQVLLQFSELPNDLQKQQLKSAGIILIDYIPHLTYTSLINFPVKNLNLSATPIKSVVEMKTAWKLDERISREVNLQATKKIRLLVSFVKEVTTSNDIENILKNEEGIITDKRFELLKTYEIEIPQNEIYKLSKEPLVKYIGLPAEIQPLNDDARASTGAALLQSPSAGFGLDGAGVTMGIGDNASAIVHVDVRDRVINFNPDERRMHGTHTTLTAAGKGIMDPKAIGMAPSVRVLTHLYDIVWAQTPYMYPDYNMTITNNSYAAIVSDCNYAGIYDQYAQMLDDYAIEYPEVENIFASGNDGKFNCGSFPTGYQTVTGGYQPSKNVLTVGATMKNNIIWVNSSRGPVKDGRLKPEVVAFGALIYSGDIYDTYGGSNGTSMAAPVVTGCMVLLEQRYKQMHNNQNAPGNLLKTLVMNGATDFGNPGPDFIYGFGLINDYRSMLMLDNHNYLIDSVNHNANKTHTITIPANTAQLKVMLYWHDPSASPLAANALINNLDLEVAAPNNTIHHPLILDPSPAGVANTAVEGIDNLNNVEQAVFNNPASGNYNVTIKGTSIPSGKQQYVVAYDIVPIGIKIKYPNSGTPLAGDDTMRIYWDASDNANNFTIEYSDNNGGSWNVLDNNIPSDQRYYFWNVPNITTSQALIKISRNNTSQQDVTGVFTINPQPKVQLSPVQCPGYIAINWNGSAGVSVYEVLKKIGDDLRVVDTVTDTSYVFSGLSFDTFYYVGVRPLVNGVRGFRSKSVKKMPNDGSCAGSISDGDLMVDAIASPGSGRKFTSTELSNNQTLSVNIRNLDDAPASNYKVSYQINGSAWISQTITNPIAANAVNTMNFTGLDLAAVGIYKIEIAVENLSTNDLVKTNDTLIKFIRQLDNNPINLNAGFTDDFENAPLLTVFRDSIGITSNDHWDYINTTDSGRLRSFVSTDVLISGQRSMSLDLQLNGLGIDNQNYFAGTFNLLGYDTIATEARAEFDYKIHGQPKFLAGNEVWVRGGDTQPWINIYTLDTTATPGQKINTGSLSITNALASNLQNFSSSFQIRIGQHDTSVIAMNEYGNGITIDNFKLYSVNNDVQLLSILNPTKLECGLDSTFLTLLIYNSDNLPQNNIQVNYKLDNGAVVSDAISIAAKDTVQFSFPIKINVSGLGAHVIDAWLVAAGDTYLSNDSILNYRFRNQPYVTSFPYLENFETNDGYWFTGGFNSSWQYGTPNSIRVKNAASGSKVWATNLTGNYIDNEQSYLYSPCFDLSALTAPMLSFSLSTDIENCGSALCDAAYIEYSQDGILWTKLGTHGQGINWYGDLQVWNESDSRWRVASIPLPTGISTLKLRFVFTSDAGASRDGIAIDDIHIFDLKYPVYDEATTTASNVVNNNTVDFISNNKILSQVIASNENLSNTEVNLYNHTSVLNPLSQQYNLSRSYAIHSAQIPNDSVAVRLFITDDEVKKLIADNSCATCNKAEDAYRLGITKYDDKDKKFENGSLGDNQNGIYTFIPYSNIQWVPYEKGYYAQVKIKSFSEFWFNTAIPDKIAAGSMVFPNPVFDDQVYIVWNAAPGAQMQIVMFDVLGRKVFTAKAVAEDYDNKTTLHLPNLEAGVYTLRYFIGDEINTVKILIR